MASTSFKSLLKSIYGPLVNDPSNVGIELCRCLFTFFDVILAFKLNEELVKEVVFAILRYDHVVNSYTGLTGILKFTVTNFESSE